MKKRKTFLFIFLTLLMLAGIATLYINKVLLPVKLHGIIETKASEFLDREVKVGSLRFNFVSGVSLEDVTIKESYAEKVFLSIKRLQFNILPMALFKKQHVIIPTLLIDTPTTHLTRSDELIWNFADFLALKNKKSSSKGSYQVILKKLVIVDGTVDVTDQSQDPHMLETLKDIQADVELKLDKTIPFRLSTFIVSNQSSMTGRGTYKLADKSLSSAITISELNLPRYIRSLYKGEDLELRTGVLKNLDLKIEHNESGLTADGKLSLEQLGIKTPTLPALAGNINFSNSHWEWFEGDLKFSGNLVTQDMNVKLADGTVLQGNISTDTEHFSMQEYEIIFKGQVKGDAINLTSKKDLAFNGKFNGEKIQLNKSSESINLIGDISVTPEQLSLTKDLKIAGPIQSNNTILKMKEGSLSLTSELHMPETLIKNGDSLHIAGNFKSPNLNVQNNEGAWTINNDFTLLQSDIQSGKTQLKGDIYSTDTAIALSAKGDLDVTQNLSINNLNVTQDDVSVNSKSLKGQNIKIKNSTANGLTFNGEFKSNELTAALAKGITFSDSPELNISLQKPTIGELTYNGFIRLNDGITSGLPQIESIKNLSGDIEFKNDSLVIPKLVLNTHDIPLTVSGNVDNFKNPQLNIHAITNNADIEKLITLLPPDIKNKIPAKISGNTSLDVTYNGLASSINPANVQVTAQLTNTNVVSEKLPEPLSNISGKIVYVGDKVSWENLEGLFKGETYKLTGDLKDFTKPFINTTVQSNLVSTALSLIIDGETIQLKRAMGTLLQSTFDVAGSIVNQNGQEPLFDISGTSKFNIADVKELSPELYKKIEFLNLSGVMNIEETFRGRIKNWKQWDVTLKASSSQYSVAGHELQNIKIDYIQKQDTIEKADAMATIYGGNVWLQSKGTITRDDDIDSRFALAVSEVDLALFREAKKLKSKDLAGKIGLTLNGQGPLIKNQDKIFGSGELHITDGLLFEHNVIKGLSQVILIPELKSTRFSEAHGKFKVGNRKVSTQNLQLIGGHINMSAQGWVDFDKNIKMTVSPTFSEIALAQSESLRKAPTALISQAIKVDVFGTLDKPEFNVESSPVRILKDTTDILTEGIGGLLEGLF